MVDTPEYTGTGVTRERLYEANDPAAADIIERGTLEGLCSQIERECLPIMAANGLPHKHQSYFCDREGNWTYQLPENLSGWACCNDFSTVVKRRGYEPVSGVGFASSMLCDVVWMRDGIRRGNHEDVALHAFYLGIKWSKRRFKDNWEADALRGRKIIESSASGGEMRAVAYKQRHDEIRADYAELVARLRDESAAKESTAKAFDISRRHLNRILSK